ncbi:MAG: DUF6519 domain-containing protein [Xanthobacteraceae bacterium]|jgi:hypothetical protein
MKGDFSRFTYDPRRHYSRVLLQQGRVLTDADWNEQGDIAHAHHVAGLRDLIGHAGVPRDRPGFAITAHGGLRFDGNSSIEIHNLHPGHFPGDGYTVEGWIRLDGAPGPATIVRRLDRERAGEAPGGFRFGLSADGRLRFERLEIADIELDEIEDFAIDAWGDLVEDDVVVEIERIARHRIAGRRRLAPGNFHHVAAVCAAGELLLLVDGKIDHRRRAGEGARFASAPVLVGCDRIGRTQHHVVGVIDRLRLWRRALDQDEIRAAMRADRPDQVDADCLWLLDADRRHEPAHGHHRHGHHHADPAPVRAEPEIRIGAGRCYVGGVVCENDASVPYQQQPDCPGLALPDSTADPGPYLVYLDAWERAVSALEDETIRDPALGGPDTAARVQTVCQVRMVKLPADAAPAVPPRPQHGSLSVQATPGLSPDENLLYRVEIHDSGVAAGSAHTVHPGLPVIAADGARLTLARPHDDVRSWAAGQFVELVCPGVEHAILATVAAVPAAPSPGELTLELRLAAADVASLAAEPSAWRVRPIATFKWSRDNGAFAFAITSIDADGARLEVDDPNRIGDVLRPRDWVEIVDRAAVLRGRAGPLRRIATIEEGEAGVLTVGLDHAVDGPDRPARAGTPQQRSLLWRWDGMNADEPGSLGVKPVATGEAKLETTTTLDGGIAITFGAGSYDTGDYWLIPVREHLEWPQLAGGTPLALRPHGIRHRTAELAVIRFAGSTVEVDDLRRVFAPLADAAGSPPPARPEPARPGPAPPTPAPPPPMMPPDPGVVPPGCSILGPSPVPPSGWRFTGARLALRRPDPQFNVVPQYLPEAGPVRAATLAGRIFCLLADGALWALDPGLPEWEAWSRRRHLHDSHLGGGALVAFDGRLHFLGGHHRDGHRSARHRCYDPATDEWHSLAPLGAPRTALAAAVLGNLLFAVGGSVRQNGDPIAEVECYSAEEDRWTARSPLPHPTADAAAAASGGRLYMFGGNVAHLLGLMHAASADVHVYSPSADRWSSASPLAAPRSGARAIAAEDRIYVVGGERGPDDPAPVELLDPTTGRWLEAPQPDNPRLMAGVALLDGTLRLLGGIDAAGPTATIEACTVEHVLYLHEKLAGE